MQTAFLILSAALTLFSAASLITDPDDIFFRKRRPKSRTHRRVAAETGG